MPLWQQRSAGLLSPDEDARIEALLAGMDEPMVLEWLGDKLTSDPTFAPVIREVLIGLLRHQEEPLEQFIREEGCV